MRTPQTRSPRGQHARLAVTVSCMVLVTALLWGSPQVEEAAATSGPIITLTLDDGSGRSLEDVATGQWAETSRSRGASALIAVGLGRHASSPKSAPPRHSPSWDRRREPHSVCRIYIDRYGIRNYLVLLE